MSDKNKAEHDTAHGSDIAAVINKHYACALCGPMPVSNYRVDITGPKHIIFPDNPQVWLNAQKCPQKCIFNTVVKLLRKQTEKRFKIETAKDKDGKKIIGLFDEGIEGPRKLIVELEGQKLGPEACIIITNNSDSLYCYSKTRARHLLMDLREQQKAQALQALK